MQASSELSLLTLIWQASIPVRLVMLLLIVFSITSWAHIFAKRSGLKRALTHTQRIEVDFWAGSELNVLTQSIAARREEHGALARIFESGMAEFIKARRANQRGEGLLDGPRRAMLATYQRELDRLETHLNFLATVGSVSPYIGLLGTV